MFIIDQDKLQEITQGFHIPAKPEILSEIQLLQLQMDYDFDKAANIVTRDVELSGDIIKAINSPFFGLKRKISDIHQAAIALGFRNIFQISTSCLLKNAFYNSCKPSCISLDRFWDEAMETALIANKLAEITSVDCTHGDAYALGLFHDCGIAAMSMRFDNYRQVLDHANKSRELELDVIEQSRFGYTHTEVGLAIAISWNVPNYLCEIIAKHHEKDLLNNLACKKQRQLAAILLMSQNLVALKHNMHELPMWSEVSSDVFEALAFTEQEYSAIINSNWRGLINSK